MACSWSTSSIGDYVQPGSRLRAAPRHAPQLRARRVSARGRQAHAPVRKFIYRRRWTTSRTARDGSKRATATGEFAIEFHNAIASASRYTDTYEFLPPPFSDRRPASTLPVGGYEFDNVRV